MISLLTPSRGRTESLQRLVDSAVMTADNPNGIEIVVMTDLDDESYHGFKHPNVRLYSTERTVLSVYWNLAYEKATGSIFMQCGDDIVFRTEGWDTKVNAAFDKYPDKIVLVYGDDGDPAEKTHGTHSFLHKNWVEAVGYFVPPYFTSDFTDTWINELADGIDRKEKVDILTEHMHPAFGKGPIDLTHAEKYVRHWKDDMPALYESKADERKADIEKLRAVCAV